MKWKIKLPLILVALASALYIVLWLKITSDIATIVSSKMSNKIFSVIQGHRVQFKDVHPSGSPFVFEVELDGFTEDTPQALITHTSPVFIGYNIFTQELYMHYSGESTIETKPFKDKKTFTSAGDFRYSVSVPINFSRVLEASTNPDVVNLFTNIYNVNFRIKDSSLEDSDKVKIVEDRNVDINFKFNHHKRYESLEELVDDIPKDYEVKMQVSNKYNLPHANELPYSLIYGVHLASNAQYSLTAAFHTNAKKVLNAINDFEIRNWHSTVTSDAEENESKINVSGKISETGLKGSWDSVSQFKLKAPYGKNLHDMLQTMLKVIPSAPPFKLEDTSSFRRANILAMDFTALDLDTKNDPVDITLKASLAIGHKNNVELDVPHLGISFHDVALDVKNNTKIEPYNNWSSEGVLSVVDVESLVKYLVSSYFKLHHISEHRKFNTDFYAKMMLDFTHKIADNVSDKTNSITIDYDLKSDVTKSKIGKFTWPETTLLYYATLLEHLNTSSENEKEAMDKFRTLVPDYVLVPESLDKIILQSKGS